MKIQHTILALVTLAALGTACDPETAKPSASAQAFRGDEIDPPTTTTTGIFKLKGGNGDPEDWAHAFEESSLESQIAFYKDADKLAVDLVVERLAADELNVEWCSHACEDQHMAWGGDFTVTYVHVEHGRVGAVEGEHGSWGWESEARVTAEVSCGCVP